MKSTNSLVSGGSGMFGVNGSIQQFIIHNQNGSVSTVSTYISGQERISLEEFQAAAQVLENIRSKKSRELPKLSFMKNYLEETIESIKLINLAKSRRDHAQSDAQHNHYTSVPIPLGLRIFAAAASFGTTEIGLGVGSAIAHSTDQARAKESQRDYERTLSEKSENIRKCREKIRKLRAEMSEYFPEEEEKKSDHDNGEGLQETIELKQVTDLISSHEGWTRETDRILQDLMSKTDHRPRPSPKI